METVLIPKALAERAAQFIICNDPFGDHFGQHDIDVLTGDLDRKRAIEIELARAIDEADALTPNREVEA